MRVSPGSRGHARTTRRWCSRPPRSSATGRPPSSRWRACPTWSSPATTSPGILPGATLPDITQLTAVGARIAGDLETLAGRVELAFTEETALRDPRDDREHRGDQRAARRLRGRADADLRPGGATTRWRPRRTSSRPPPAWTRWRRRWSRRSTRARSTRSWPTRSRRARTSQQLSARLDGRDHRGARGWWRSSTPPLSTMSRPGGRPGARRSQEVGPTIAEARPAMATLQRAAARIEQGEGTLGPPHRGPGALRGDAGGHRQPPAPDRRPAGESREVHRRAEILVS